MIIRKNFPGYIILFLSLASCEHIVDIDLKSADPAFVVEAVIFKDSVCYARLTKTNSYFSKSEPGYVTDAIVTLSDGNLSEELNYKGFGFYVGSVITGTPGRTYAIKILKDGILYEGISTMYARTDLISLQTGKSESPGILNPLGKTVFTLTCLFADNPHINNFYLVRFLSADKMIENYYLLTEYSNIGGSLSNVNDTINFSESIFYEGGEVEVQLFSIDEPVYKYFVQLNDVLFWKRRIMPPTPYNPVSNISNGVMGYFAAWSYDSKKDKARIVVPPTP